MFKLQIDKHASTPTQELSTHTLKPGTCALTLREMHQPKFNGFLNKIWYLKIFNSKLLASGIAHKNSYKKSKSKVTLFLNGHV